MTFRPMLAATADMSKLTYPVLCTPKLDGIRCIIRSGVACSRTLKPIPNKHIQRLLSECPDDLDGELIVPGKTFNEIQSLVMKESGHPDIEYHVFDIVEDDVPYVDRMEALGEIDLPSVCTKILPVEIKTEASLTAYENEMVDDGYEGIMIRDPEGPYKFGRSTVKEGYLLKWKRFSDAEAEIIGTEELLHNHNEAELDERGFTKRSHHRDGKVESGMLGAFLVRDGEKVFKVSSGLTAKERIEYWDIRDTMIGQLVKYKYQEAGAKSLPRFPVFLGIRHPDDV
jgi:DNA ligase 1